MLIKGRETDLSLTDIVIRLYMIKQSNEQT